MKLQMVTNTLFQQLAELEKLEKENREKSRKLERKNVDLTQTNKKLENRNKLLLDEVNATVGCLLNPTSPNTHIQILLTDICVFLKDSLRCKVQFKGGVSVLS